MWIHRKERTLTRDSLSNQKLWMESLTFSSFLIQLHKEQLSQLTFMLPKTRHRFQRMQSSISLMLYATITITGQTQSKFQHLACLRIKLQSIEVRSEIFLLILISIDFHFSFERLFECKILINQILTCNGK